MQLCKLYLTNVERAYDCKNSYQFILLLGTIWDSIWPVHITGLQTIWSLLSLNHIFFSWNQSRICTLFVWDTLELVAYTDSLEVAVHIMKSETSSIQFFFYRKRQACSVLPLLPFSLVIPFSRATPFIPNCKASQLSWRVKPFEVWSKL